MGNIATKATRVKPFGYAVEGTDLRFDVDDALVADITELLNEQGFVLFRDQKIDAAQQAALARRFGPFSGHNASDRQGLQNEDGGGFSLRIYDNRTEVGAMSALDFHSDNAHSPCSVRYLCLYGLDFGDGQTRLSSGETLLANAAQAVDRLPAELRDELERRECRISAKDYGTFVRPCIERHWLTGRPYLVPSALTEEIVGLSPEDSARMIERIHAVLYDPEFVYRHEWREGDFLFWDNRLLHHGRADFDNSQTRIIRRCAIADEAEPTAIARVPA